MRPDHFVPAALLLLLGARLIIDPDVLGRIGRGLGRRVLDFRRSMAGLPPMRFWHDRGLAPRDRIYARLFGCFVILMALARVALP